MDKDSQAVRPVCVDSTWDGLIDDDILIRFKDVNVYYGDIINAQLIKTIKELILELRKE